jgi:hypothetical protein
VIFETTGFLERCQLTEMSLPELLAIQDGINLRVIMVFNKGVFEEMGLQTWLFCGAFEVKCMVKLGHLTATFEAPEMGHLS